MDTDVYRTLVQLIEKRTHIELSQYQDEHVKRRLNGFISKYQLNQAQNLLTWLEQPYQDMTPLKDHLTVNVSEFFRNPERYDDLNKIVIKDWKKNKRNEPIKIWSAGCSIGAELYSLGILLNESSILNKAQLLGTDIDPAMIAIAKKGQYKTSSLQHLPAKYLNHYFSEEIKLQSNLEKNAVYSLTSRIKQLSTFKKHDLLKDPFPINQDLIMCRNVVIYFKEATKLELYQKLYSALNTGGYLFVGGTESLPSQFKPMFELVAPHIYRRFKSST